MRKRLCYLWNGKWASWGTLKRLLYDRWLNDGRIYWWNANKSYWFITWCRWEDEVAACRSRGMIVLMASCFDWLKGRNKARWVKIFEILIPFWCGEFLVDLYFTYFRFKRMLDLTKIYRCSMFCIKNIM